MKREMNKKGISMHLEMIISFSIFIIFVLLLLLYIRPYQRASFSEAMMNNLHDKFGSNVHVSFIKFYLDVHSSEEVSSVCIDMSSFPFDIHEANSIVYNEKNEITSSRSGNGALCIKSGNGNYLVSLAKEFPSGTQSGTPIEIESYSIGGIENQDYWAGNEIKNLKERYDSKTIYPTLKTQLGLPLNVDFAILCLDCKNEDYNMTREIPDQSDVLATQYNERVLNEEGDIFTRKFLLKIW
jgi:hypothetical protein